MGKHPTGFITDNDTDAELSFYLSGKNRSFKQIKDMENSYLAIDDDFTVNDKKIPLWLFGFLY